DHSPLRGLGYYRLRQVDMDGSFAYSPSVMVSLDGLAFSIYPNPVTDYLQLKGSGDWQAELVDARGRLLLSRRGTDAGILDLRALSAGVYFLRLQAAGETHSLSIRKQ
ncbi:MAG: T9SS C-terminal target domain-containing protein, partial [Bacteroidetes bacterium]